MATIDDVNALNIRPRTIIRINVYDSDSNLLLTITEEELIRATVSLRSDLSRINPTLPESEIEIEAYFENDISDTLAAAGEELNIRYRWWPETSSYGYNRYFYTDERITWNNKILHIHAVDQVHLLDEELPPLYVGQDWYWHTSSISDHNVLHGLTLWFRDLIRGTRTSNRNLLRYSWSDATESSFNNEDGTFASVPEGGALNILHPRMTRREAIAKIMNCFHWDFDSGTLKTKTDFWPSYVDAGQPTVRSSKPTTAPLVIKKEDCGNFTESKEPVISSLTAKVNEVLWIGNGDFDHTYDGNMKSQIIKQKGITFEYGGFGDTYDVGAQDPDVPNEMYYFYTWPYADDFLARKRPPVDYLSTGTRDAKALRNQYGKWLLDEGVSTNSWSPDPNNYTFVDLSGSKWTQPFYPESPDTPASVWNYWISVDIIQSGAESTDGYNYAAFFVPTNEKTITKTRGGTGQGVVLDDIFLTGHAKLRRYDDTGTIDLLPAKALDCIMEKSNVVGSFTWKGDPRMQPRDFVELQQPDENLADQDGVLLQTEDGDDIIINLSKIITLENITLTHEGGGTVAEITYREGYC